MLARLILAALLLAQPPVQASGARVVDLRDANGGIARFVTIPSSSVFRTYGGGSRCHYVSPGESRTSDGTPVAAGQTVESTRWMFVEGLPESIGEPTPQDPSVSRGPLASAVRWFTVFCDSLQHAVGIVSVGARDPMFDPHQRLTELYQRLQLVRPVVFRNPVVDRWGGLITRYQSWLAVTPGAWVGQRSGAVQWRGWTMYLLARPVAMDFRVDFEPAPGRPSAAFHGIVPCVARNAAVQAGAGALPAMPRLPEQSTPGVNGACRWTPPGPGSVTVQARLTYRVTFWANGWTEALPDYTWTSLPATFAVGELTVVNTNR